MMTQQRKIIIVDDEKVIRDGLKSVIAWEKNGYRLVGEASNGQEALELCERMRPDIVITDIVMPVMDGVELIKRLKADFPYIKVIVLTCYNDFSYAREAFRHGAIDYFLKFSVDYDQFIHKLNDISVMDHHTTSSLLPGDEGNETDSFRLSRLKNRFFSELITGCFLSTDEIEQKAELLGLKLPASDGCLIVTAVRGDNPVSPIVIEELSAIVNEEGIGDVFEVNASRFAILLSLPYGEQHYDFIVALCERISLQLSGGHGMSALFGIGEPFNRYDNIQHIFKQAEEALKYKFYMDREDVIHLPSLVQTGQKLFSTQPPSLDNQQLTRHIVEPNFEKLSEAFERLCSLLGEQRVHPDFVKEMFVNLMSSSVRALHAYDISVNLIFPDHAKPYLDIIQFETLKEIKAYFLDFYRRSLDKISALFSDKYRKEVSDAIKYINKNYDREITLQNVAEEVNFSPSYFSQIFRDEVGESFTDYLIRFRMNEAKRLLRTTRLKIYEISDRVGIMDASYFCRAFKKAEDISPIEYRKRYAAEHDPG